MGLVQRPCCSPWAAAGVLGKLLFKMGRSASHTLPAGAAHELFVCPPLVRCAQDERGVSRDEMSAALVEVAEGRVPKDRIALK